MATANRYILTTNGNFYLVPSDVELYHHGVKGQKWGVRRYQNEDGSLTPAGKKRLKGSGRMVLVKGTELGRVSSQETTDAVKGSKLYVSVDDKEREVYKRSIGAHNIMNNGKAFVHKYLANNDIVIPSIKTQSKIERDLVKDPEVRKELVDSLMKKGMSREEATKAVKPFNDGIEFLKHSPALLLAPINPVVAAIPFLEVKAKRDEQLNLIRNSVGDKENKHTNQTFENKLKEQGYNAYRDTNDRLALRTKSAIVVVDPDKNTGLSESHKLTKEEFGKAHATTKEFYNKRITKNVAYEDLVKDGEKEYDKLKEDYVVSKHRKAERDKILKKHKKELED